MFELCRAEWIKIVGHRRAFVYLLGIFPLSAAAILFFAAVVAAFVPDFKDTVESSLSDWVDLLLTAWVIPGHPAGRIFLMGFTAFTFAGEYQWGTWKNITPRRRRPALIVVKFFVLSVVVLIAFTLLSLILPLGGAVTSAVAGVPFGPAFDFEQIRTVVPTYFLSAAMAFFAFLITAIFAAFVSIYTRSILGGSLAGIFLIFAEVLLLMVPRWLSSLFGMPGILHLQRVVPQYNLENIRSWIQTEKASNMLDGSFVSAGLSAPGDGVIFSIMVVAGWVVLGVAAIAMLFERQDITT